MRMGADLAATLTATALLLTACSSAPPYRAPPPRSPETSKLPPTSTPETKEKHSSSSRRPPRTVHGAAPRWEKDGPPNREDVPEDVELTPDPIPTFEPPSAGGNASSYRVFGKKYHTLETAEGYDTKGLASWYGKKFHGRRTSNGETYDMFALTAAHKTLPLPTYARVTNLANGKQVIVRINDRGPFHPGRIIDLSYAAAARLGSIGEIPEVRVEALTPDNWPPASADMELETPPSASELASALPANDLRWKTARVLQLGAFSDPINAIATRENLNEQGFPTASVRESILQDGRVLHRVIIGPFESRQETEAATIRARSAGYSPLPLQD